MLDSKQQLEEKGCIMVIADPSDIGHGKSRRGSISGTVFHLVFNFQTLKYNLLIKHI